MVNNLEKFFPNDQFPTLFGKYIGFFTWMHGAGKLGARSQLCFMHTRNWMLEGALEMGVNPKAKLFSKYSEMPSFCKVERLLKPPNYSMANPACPTNGPPSKRSKINLNADSPESFQQIGNSHGPARDSGGYKRGAGRWINNTRPRSRNTRNNQQQRWNSPQHPNPYRTRNVKSPLHTPPQQQ
jgi:hypothetical protein